MNCRTAVSWILFNHCRPSQSCCVILVQVPRQLLQLKAGMVHLEGTVGSQFFSDTDRWVLKYWCCLLPPPVKPLGIVIYLHPNASVSAWKQLSMLKQIHLALGTDTQDSMLSCLSGNTLTRLLSYVYHHRLQAHWHGSSPSSTGQLTKLSTSRHSFSSLVHGVWCTLKKIGTIQDWTGLTLSLHLPSYFADETRWIVLLSGTWRIMKCI